MTTQHVPANDKRNALKALVGAIVEIAYGEDFWIGILGVAERLPGRPSFINEIL
jgi:hypothetical protein